MKHFFYFLFFVVFSITTFAQNKQLTMSDAVVGQWRKLYPERLLNIQWSDEKIVVYQDFANLYKQNITADNKKEKLLRLKELNKALKTIEKDTLSYLPYVHFENKDEFTFSKQNYWYCYSLKEKRIVTHIELPKKANNLEVFFDKKAIAYTLDNNLFIAFTDKTLQITNDEDKNIVNGQIVSRNEFGIEKGIFWSPKGNKLAFYRKDNSKVKDYPLVDITAREAEFLPIKYPMAGMDSEHISLGVFDFSTKKTVFIEKDDTVSEKYLTNITWSLDEINIFIQVLNREQNFMKLNRYNSQTGNLEKTLFTETHKKYVEPLHSLLFIDNKKFIYQTRTYGYNHAYLYNVEGEKIKQLTSGNWEIINLLGYDKNYIYYTATKESPIEVHSYKTSLKDGITQKITNEKGVHKVNFNKKFSYFTDEYSNTNTPRVVNIVNNDGEKVKNLLTAKNPLSEYDMPEMKIGTIKSADGKTDLYYRLIKPTNFDSTKSYPAIVYVYGGPHAQMITNSWLGGTRMWQYLMAQKGYVMLTVDNRGSANRGLEFENVIFRQCGVNEMKDQMEGIKFLKNLPYVNQEKIGVHGWSYGGFMTISLQLNYPEIFKVACAGGPVIDWKYYEIMYGERYMDNPKDNPEGYKYTSLLPRAKDLKGKLLIVHGALDPTVVMQHSQLFVRECIKKNIPIDYFIYPRAEHNVRGYDRIHLMQKVTDYFDDYLK